MCFAPTFSIIKDSFDGPSFGVILLFIPFNNSSPVLITSSPPPLKIFNIFLKKPPLIAKDIVGNKI